MAVETVSVAIVALASVPFKHSPHSATLWVELAVMKASRGKESTDQVASLK